MRRFSNTRSVLDAQGGSLGVFGLWSCLPTNFVNATDAVWPVANLAIYIPVRVVEPTPIINMAICNGAAVAGNTDIGIYSENGTRIISSGSTAQSGTTALQKFTLATIIGPGMYYLAIAHDEAVTGQFLRFTFSTGALMGQAIGLAEQTSAFPLPATATLASSSNNYLPVIACGTKGTGIV